MSSDAIVVKPTGALTAREVPGLYRDSLSWRHGELPQTVELSGVEQTDSSAVALLLEWLSWARARGREMQFTNPPRSLRIIASLSQADALLGWEDLRQ